MKCISSVGFVVLLVWGPVFAADAPPEKTGIKVGQKAPEFKLKDQSGKERTLSGLLESGPVALVFYRSASW